MANTNGGTANLVASHPGNTSAFRHGARATLVRPLSAAEHEQVEALMELPHTVEADRPAAEELVRIRSLIERVDKALVVGKMESRRRPARPLLDHRRRLSEQYLKLLKEFGLTPASRASWVRTLADGSVGERIRRRLEDEGR